MKNTFFILLAICLSNCDYYDARLHIKNLSDNDIFIEFYKYKTPEYPSLNKTEYYKRNFIYRDSTQEFVIPGKNAWENFIVNSYNNKLNLYIFNVKDLESSGCIDSLILKKKYKILLFSKKSLDSLKWKIIYK